MQVWTLLMSEQKFLIDISLVTNLMTTIFLKIISKKWVQDRVSAKLKFGYQKIALNHSFDFFNSLGRFRAKLSGGHPSSRGWLTPSNSPFVWISPQMQFKDKFGRSTIIESWKTFIDYEEDGIPAFQDDIPSGTDCQRHFTMSSINLHEPEAFSIQLETINPTYKFISSVWDHKSEKISHVGILSDFASGDPWLKQTF